MTVGHNHHPEPEGTDYEEIPPPEPVGTAEADENWRSCGHTEATLTSGLGRSRPDRTDLLILSSSGLQPGPPVTTQSPAGKGRQRQRGGHSNGENRTAACTDSVKSYHCRFSISLPPELCIALTIFLPRQRENDIFKETSLQICLLDGNFFPLFHISCLLCDSRRKHFL